MNNKKTILRKIIAWICAVVSLIVLAASCLAIVGYFAFDVYFSDDDYLMESVFSQRIYGEIYPLGSEIITHYFTSDFDDDDQPLKEKLAGYVRSQSNLIIMVTNDQGELLFEQNIDYDQSYALDYFYDIEDVSGDHQTFTVVAALQDPLMFDDAYLRTSNWVQFYYSFRYTVYLIAAVALVIGIASLVYLLETRRIKDKNHLRTIDKIPLELLLGGYILLIIMTADLYLSSFEITVMAGIVVITGLIGLSTLARRIRTHTLVTETLTYRLMKFAGRLFMNFHLAWKIMAAAAVMVVFDCWILLMFRYESGAALMFIVLKNALLAFLSLRLMNETQRLKTAVKAIAQGDLKYPVEPAEYHPFLREFALPLSQISEGTAIAVEKQLQSERMKTELITNVSHDIKTPITSIINYVDLMDKENNNHDLNHYLDVLKRQSLRLKNLVEDLVETSKLSTGNITMKQELSDIDVLVNQAIGEYSDRMKEKNLELIVSSPDIALRVSGDGHYLWRLIDNLMNNAYQYSLQGTRIYINLETIANYVVIELKNISQQSLNVDAKDLMERFTRGDSSRNTEGSGLGLSIAENIVRLHGGTFEISIDGDLFKVVIRLPSTSDAPAL